MRPQMPDTVGYDELGRMARAEAIALAIKLFYVNVGMALDKDVLS